MKKEVMCAHGACQNTMEAGKGRKITVTITHNGIKDDQQHFCCEAHAAKWLEYWATIRASAQATP